MKKALLVILWLLLSLILPACQSMSYEEIEVAATRPDATEKEVKRLERYENTIEKANAHFEQKYGCFQQKGVMWFCPNGASAKEPRRGHIQTTEELVRAYRKEQFSHCGCANSRAVMRALARGF